MLLFDSDVHAHPALGLLITFAVLIVIVAIAIFVHVKRSKRVPTNAVRVGVGDTLCLQGHSVVESQCTMFLSAKPIVHVRIAPSPAEFFD